MKKLLTILAVLSLFAIACKSNSNVSENNEEIDYIIAKNYYVKNSIETIDNPKIESNEKFDEIFGMATLQGDDGKPTEIDFDKQFVIAVIKPPTQSSTTLNPISLKSKEGKLEFAYSLECGEIQSYTIKPFLLIIVDKKYNSDVLIVEIEQNNTASDIEGNVYKVVKIGEQLWFAENLKTTKYNDGNDIVNETDNSAWLEATLGAFCWFENDITAKDTYGAFYNWHAVNSEKLCPKGWHVPSVEEWENLVENLGGKEIAGGKMKAIGTDKWQNPNAEATNESGFNALPSGYRNLIDGTFQDSGWGTNFWSSNNSEAPTTLFLDYNSGKTFFQEQTKEHGFSVRCVKD